MASTLLVEVVTPEATVFNGEAEMLIATTTTGEIGILPLHAPIVAELAAGELRLKMGAVDEVVVFATYGGYLQFAEDRAIILTDLAVDVRHADVVALEAEILALEARIKNTPADAVDELAAHNREMEWLKNCVCVAKRHKK